MNYKRSAILKTLGTLVVLILFAFGYSWYRSSTAVIQNVDVENAPLFLYVYDGGQVSAHQLTNATAESEVLNIINIAAAKKADPNDVEIRDTAAPIYGISIQGLDGTTLRGAWQDGYWFTEGGAVYVAELDFDDMLTHYLWQTADGVSLEDFPCYTQVTGAPQG